MAEQENARTIREVFDVWNAHDPDRYVKRLGDSWTAESDTIPAPVTGRDGAREFMKVYVTGFPDDREVGRHGVWRRTVVDTVHSAPAPQEIEARRRPPDEPLRVARKLGSRLREQGILNDSGIAISIQSSRGRVCTEVSFPELGFWTTVRRLKYARPMRSNPGDGSAMAQ